MISAGFLSGQVPFALLIIALVGLVVLFAGSFVVELKVLGYQRSGRNFSVFHNTRSTAERFTAYAAFILDNFAFVIGVNAAYVYVALYESGSLLLAMQVLLSFFKLFWNNSAPVIWYARYPATFLASRLRRWKSTVESSCPSSW